MNVKPDMDVALPHVPGLDAAALKAVRDSVPGKLLGRTAAVLAALVLVLSFAEKADTSLVHLGLLLSPKWLNAVLLISIPILVISAQLFNEMRAARDRRAVQELAIRPAAVPDDYFRIGPYLDTEKDQRAFKRADQAHEKVSDWLLRSALVPLYLTGDSGSGKSSILNAFALPFLRKQGWTVVQVRAAQDVETALRVALGSHGSAHPGTLGELCQAVARRCDGRLLIVLDQFEEFIILASAASQVAFAALLADLQQRPDRGFKILLVVRSDYQAALEEIGLPRLLQGENFFPVGRFREESARNFIRGSKLGLKDKALERLLKSAAELDDTPGMIRPITLNVLGFLLHQRGGSVASSVDAGRIVRDYIAQTVENSAIRAWAPHVLWGLLTEQGTKRPRLETELAAEAKLRPAEVRAVLNALAGAALARPLEATQGTWELSHDFVAHAVNRYLGRRRGTVMRQAVGYAAPVLLTLGIVTFVSTVEWHRLAPVQTRAELAELGILVQTINGNLNARATSRFTRDKFYSIGPLLRRLPLFSLDLSVTQIANLNPLNGLITLHQINLSRMPVANLDPLKGLTALQQLDLSETPIANLDPLKGLTALQQLDLAGTPVANLDPLKSLSALQQLDLAGTQVVNLDPLKGLTALQQLDLAGTPVANLDPLKGLSALQQLDLAGTQVANLDPLKSLSALQQLDLHATSIANLDPLKGLTALQQLDLAGTQVVNLDPLKRLTALQQLDLHGTQVASLDPLKGLTTLQKLILSGTHVANLDPLKGLTALQQLGLAGTQVTNLDPLKGLSALQRLDLSDTQVVNLDPLKGLSALQHLYLYDTQVANLELQRFKEYRKQNGFHKVMVNSNFR